VSQEPTPEERRALFRVVRGEPDDAEAAALTVVLAAMTAAEPPQETSPRSRWSGHAAHLRRPLPVGPDAWRTTYWPR
jgi:Acyl-CoA carboxylase epsilon subunit